MTSANWEDQIEDHYRSVWLAEGEVCAFAAGPVHQLPVEFRILRYPPRPKRQMWTYATVGMSQPADQVRLELHLFAPDASPTHVELLAAVAHYHRTGERLGMGHTVNFGRPWLPVSSCDFGLLSLPYLDGPALENAEIGALPVQCLWLVPITKDEADFKQRAGLEALEQKFEALGFDYLNAGRPSSV